jgi:CubicO group peptidase (beta-lactamase class C family)
MRAWIPGVAALTLALLIDCSSRAPSASAPPDDEGPQEAGAGAQGADSGAQPTGGGAQDAGGAASSDSGATSDGAAQDGGVAYPDPPIPAAFQAFADAFDAERKSLGASGAAVAILQGGQVTFAHGFGTKGPNSTAPVDAHTLFRIGSMTKALTATAFMSLVAQGKADPSATMVSVAPDVDFNFGDAGCGGCGAEVTLDELLSHQTGLLDYLAISGPTTDSALSDFLTGSDFATNEYFMDPPDSFWNYSNPNFYLVGLAVERASGVSYRQALQQRVLGPLGMNRTFLLPSDVVADGDYTNASSTDVNGNPWDVSPSSYDNGWARPAGYAFSSVLDYALFVQFLNAGNPAVLPDAQRKQMMTSRADTLEIGDVEGYGYGLLLESGFFVGNNWYDVPEVWHDGSIPGFATEWFLIPSTGFGIVAFANADNAYFDSSLGVALQSFAGLGAAGTAPTLTSDPKTFPALAGNYDDPNNVGRVIVSVDTSDNVTVSMPDLDAAKITYTAALTPAGSPYNFTETVDGAEEDITFIPDPSGKNYKWFRTRDYVAEWVGAQKMPRRDRPIDASALRARLHAHRPQHHARHPSRP